MTRPLKMARGANSGCRARSRHSGVGLSRLLLEFDLSERAFTPLSSHLFGRLTARGLRENMQRKNVLLAVVTALLLPGLYLSQRASA